jgi:DNA-binding MarR family transcriptional regulator
VVNSESKNTVLGLWLLLHRVHDSLALCEDSIFKGYGLTSEQFRVLAAVKGRGGSSRPSELARILERSPNSISMLIDRMVKAGLVKRTRDRKDRRAVNVSMTGKAEKCLGPAGPAGWEFIQKILSPLSHEDKRILASLLEKTKCELLGYLNPEADMAEIVKNSVTNRPDLYKEWTKTFPAGSEAKRQGGRKRKTV